MMRLVIVTPSLLSLAASVSPVFPSEWQGEFVETNVYPHANYSVDGAMYYSWPQRAQRINRASSLYSPLCSRYHKVDTPCHQYYLNSSLVFVWPAEQRCCRGCSDHCGPLTPTWLDSSTYTGVHQVSVNGTTTACNSFQVSQDVKEPAN